ncbi:MAG: AMP-dependent synthetase [Gemmatimonadales bacterium]|nr:MAG: AMP-dependent synthetase [Gemmatimonadales bacterium]
MPAPRSLNHLFFEAVDRFSTKRAALRYKARGAWQDISHQELARRVQHTAIGFRELGASPGDRIAIVSHNRPEWAISDYGALTGRFVTVPVYPTLPAGQVAHILRDSGAAIAVVEDLEQYEKIKAHKESLPELRAIVILDPADGLGEAIAFSHLMRQGAAAESKHPNYKAQALEAGPDDLASIIYTSGTTGEPKGVMLTHGNFCSNIHAALEVLPIGPSDSCLSFLPLSHAFERMAGHFAMLHAGATINYAESFDTVAADLLEVRPTIVLAVPRVYEKIYARALAAADQGGAFRRRIFFWSRRIGRAWAEHRLSGKPVPLTLKLQYAAADRLVFAKLRSRTGGRIRYFVSGGAPLSPEVAWFFFAAKLPILEGYGLTETSPVVSVNPLEAPKIGTVGRPLPGVEVRIAEDGEILVRGPNVMKGYYNRPEASAEAIDQDGFFHTGDIGELDSDGYLKITDRKKDLIVTAGGKNIAPQPIENLARSSKFVLNAVMVGDRRPYPILLVVPDMEEVKRWAAERKLPEMDTAALLQHPDVVAKIEREVMLQLRDVARFEMPKKIALLERDFSIEDGELTPTLKVKRRVIEEKYRDLIERTYAE